MDMKHTIDCLARQGMLEHIEKLEAELEELQEKYDALVIENGSRYGLVSPRT